MTDEIKTDEIHETQKIKIKLSKVISVCVTAAAVIFIDQLSKTLVYDRKPDFHVFWIFYFKYTLNSGAAFSLFSSSSVYVEWIAGVVVVVLILFAIRSVSFLQAIGFGLVIGGATSNLSDRVFRHINNSVIDFIYTKYWPTFNVADSCITIGIVLVIISYIKNQTGHERNTIRELDSDQEPQKLEGLSSTQESIEIQQAIEMQQATETKQVTDDL